MAFILILILILILLIITYSRNNKKEKKKPIKESEKTLKYTIHELSNNQKSKSKSKNTPKLLSNSLEFEPADIVYYQTQKLINQPKPTTQNYITDNEYAINDAYWHNTNELHNTDGNNEWNDLLIEQIHDFGFEQPQNHNNIVNEILVPGVDTQNVHDTSINKYIRNIFRDIPLTPHSKWETDQVIDEILEYANDNTNDKNKNDIGKVLSTIRSRNSIISNLNDQKELDILTTIWNEANAKETDEQRNNIKDMLMIQIADTMSPSNYVLCPTGFADRISTSLIVEDPEKFPKTQAMINDEMMQTMSNIRNELEKDEQYTKLNDDDQVSQLKEKFFEKAEKDYEGILTKKEIDKVVEPWINML
jgi:hypothetical protein